MSPIVSPIVRALRYGAAGMALLAALGAEARACSCASPSVDEFLGYTAAIFTGVVRDVAPAERGHVITTFRVTRGYKGASRGDIVRVRHRSFRPGNCGKTFKAGQRYTVPASRHDDAMLSTNSCSFWIMNRHWQVLRERLAR